MTPPEIEPLLVHEPFLRSVARALLAGDPRVDDVVQETWLAALKSSPRSPGATRFWLAGPSFTVWVEHPGLAAVPLRSVAAGSLAERRTAARAESDAIMASARGVALRLGARPTARGGCPGGGGVR